MAQVADGILDGVFIAVLGDSACGKSLLVSKMLTAVSAKISGRSEPRQKAYGVCSSLCRSSNSPDIISQTHNSISTSSVSIHSIPVTFAQNTVTNWITLLDCSGTADGAELESLKGYLEVCSGFIFVYDDFIPQSHQHLADRWLPLALESLAGRHSASVKEPAAFAAEAAHLERRDQSHLRRRFTALSIPRNARVDFPVFTVHNMRDSVASSSRQGAPREMATPSARSSAVNISKPPAAHLHCDLKSCGTGDVARVLDFLASLSGTASSAQLSSSVV